MIARIVQSPCLLTCHIYLKILTCQLSSVENSVKLCLGSFPVVESDLVASPLYLFFFLDLTLYQDVA